MAYDTNLAVNVAECLALADFLEALKPRQFSIQTYGNVCNTVACVCGWQNIRKGRPASPEDEEAWRLPMEELNLTDSQTEAMFDLFLRQPEDTSPQQAAVVLRHLAATGVVDWSVAEAAARAKAATLQSNKETTND